MPVVRSLLLVVAGIGGGLTGSIAGLASLVSYPALLAAGLGPVSANVTNTVALVGSSVGSVSGSVPELRGEGPALCRLLPAAVVGGAAGGLLVLVTPAHAFAVTVPVLIAVASVAMLVPTPDRHRATAGSPRRAVLVWVFAIGAYGGYFGAAAGVLLLAVLLIVDGRSLLSSSAMKNVLLGAANAIAAVAFVFFGPVRWSDALPLALGLLVGGRIGPGVVRRAPARPLRILIALAGLGLAIELAVTTYG